jgi:lysozyme
MDPVIDLSHHNGSGLDFTAACTAGVIGIIHKATQGLSSVDPMYATNKPAIKAANLLFGSYHFGDGSDGSEQAKAFLATAAPTAGELVALDLENNPSGSSMTLEEARAFVTEIFNTIGKWPVLYSGHDLKGMLNGAADPVLANCPLWLAQYGSAAVLPPGWANYSLWQYTDGALGNPPPVPGIGHCDRDKFNGDATNLPNFWESVSP